MTRPRRLSLSPLLLLVAACTQEPSLRIPGLEDQQVLGKQQYTAACEPCHGPSGRGDGPVAAELKHPPGDLTQLAARNGGAYPSQFVTDVITGARDVPAHGTREMPVWNVRFGPTDSGATAVAALYQQRRIDAVVAYVASLQAQPPAPAR
jgi:hypothetical protein